MHVTLAVNRPVSVRTENILEVLASVMADLAVELYDDGHDTVKVKLLVSAE